MTGKSENIFEVCVYNPDGFTERDYFQVRDEVLAANPDYWQLFQPSTVNIFFLHRKNGQERSDKLISKIQRLKKSSALFAALGVGVDQRDYIVDIDSLDKITTMPIGISLKAINNAKKDSSAGVAG